MNDAPHETDVTEAHILMVDDDLELAQTTCRFLAERGFDIDHAKDVPHARGMIEEGNYELFLVDLVMPGTSGKVLCRELASRSDAGIIMVSSVSDDAERIALLELGADDYIIKPFNDLELLARVRAVRRRRKGRESQVRCSCFGAWELVEDERHLQHEDGRLVTLTSSEAQVMRYFTANPDVLCSREDLLAIARVRQHGGAGDRSVDTLIRRLRTKIESDPGNPKFIQTVWGQGYVFCPG